MIYSFKKIIRFVAAAERINVQESSRFLFWNTRLDDNNKLLTDNFRFYKDTLSTWLLDGLHRVYCNEAMKLGMVWFKNMDPDHPALLEIFFFYVETFDSGVIVFWLCFVAVPSCCCSIAWDGQHTGEKQRGQYPFQSCFFATSIVISAILLSYRDGHGFNTIDVFARWFSCTCWLLVHTQAGF